MSDDDDMQEEIDPCTIDYSPPPPKITKTPPRGVTTRRSAAGAHAAEEPEEPAPAAAQEPAESPTKPKYFNSRVRCPYGCNKVLAQRTIDYHRTNGCRMGQEEPFADSTRKKNYCCGVCYAEFVTRPAFLAHLSEEHDVTASVHHLTFPNKQMFMRFVRWLEAEGGAHFRHKSGAKRRASGKGIFMACNRSGYVGRSLMDPIRNKTGNFRTGYTCTGFIHGTEHNDGTITIEFCGDHYGHDARMRLPNVIKQLIAQKQMDGESFVEITNYLRRQFAPFANECIYAQRVCLVDLDELRTLLVTSTRKWEHSGIPAECEIWEEEFLEKAGITREGAPKMRKEGDKPTDELAKEQKWPRPRVFTAKMKVNGGYVELPELNKATAETRRDVSLLNTKTTTTPAKKVAPPNVFRENLRTVAVNEDADAEEPEISVDRDSPELQEDTGPKEKEKKTSQPAPAPATKPPAAAAAKTAASTEGKEPEVSLKTGPKALPGKHFTRNQIINNMLAELKSLEKMIKNDSASASGTYLVAFNTRIKQLKTSYANGIAPVNQPMGEQQSRILNPAAEAEERARKEGNETRQLTQEELAQEDEDVGEIGADPPNAVEAAKKIAELIGGDVQYNPLFWT